MSNHVRFFIYKSIAPMMKNEDYAQLGYLAWKAAQKKQMLPTRILIRSWAHDTTGGKPDPNGMHYTICFKDRNTEASKEHVAYHAYVPYAGSYQLIKETFSNQKADSTKRNAKEVVWDDSKIEEVHSVVYGAAPPTGSNPSSRPPSRGGAAAAAPAKPGSNPSSRPPSRGGATTAAPGKKPASNPPSRPSSSGKGAVKK